MAKHPDKVYDIEDGDRAILEENNFPILRKIGQGFWRDVYEVFTLDSGGRLARAVAKIEKQDRGSDSVQHRINMSKGLLAEKEAKILQSLKHDNIVSIHDIFTSSGHDVLIEEFCNAMSLEDHVRHKGPIESPSLFKKLFTQAAGALHYLHMKKGILHRDIKSSNLLLSNADYRMLLTDFQNAELIENINGKNSPTRGGSFYTHPSLLNNLVNGGDSPTSVGTDIYALGVCMFFALSGKHPFDYKVVEHSSGRPIRVGNETIKVGLKNGKRFCSSINLKQHNEMLERQLQSIPPEYRQLLYECLSIGDKKHSRIKSLLKALPTAGSPKVDTRKLKALIDYYEQGAPDYYGIDVSETKAKDLDNLEAAILRHGNLLQPDAGHAIIPQMEDLAFNYGGQRYSLDIGSYNLELTDLHACLVFQPHTCPTCTRTDMGISETHARMLVISKDEETVSYRKLFSMRDTNYPDAARFEVETPNIWQFWQRNRTACIEKSYIDKVRRQLLFTSPLPD